MRFLVDADLPRAVGQLLVSCGHEADDVRDLGLRCAKDPVIAAYAKDQRLCLLSGDWGFSDIRRFPPGEYHGIVILGIRDRGTAKDALELLQLLIDRPDIIEHLEGRLAIVEKHKIRLRPAL